MRLTFTDEEFKALYEGVDGQLKDLLLAKLNKYRKSDTKNKVGATKNANEAKINKSKHRILLAIKELNKGDTKITPYAVAKFSGMSYNTCKKYLQNEDPV